MPELLSAPAKINVSFPEPLVRSNEEAVNILDAAKSNWLSPSPKSIVTAVPLTSSWKSSWSTPAPVTISKVPVLLSAPAKINVSLSEPLVRLNEDVDSALDAAKFNWLLPSPKSIATVTALIFSLRTTESLPAPAFTIKLLTTISLSLLPKVSLITSLAIAVLKVRLSLSPAALTLISVATIMPSTSISTPSASALSASSEILSDWAANTLAPLLMVRLSPLFKKILPASAITSISFSIRRKSASGSVSSEELIEISPSVERRSLSMVIGLLAFRSILPIAVKPFSLAKPPTTKWPVFVNQTLPVSDLPSKNPICVSRDFEAVPISPTANSCTLPELTLTPVERLFNMRPKLKIKASLVLTAPPTKPESIVSIDRSPSVSIR